MSLHTYILKPINDNKKRNSLSMTDTSDPSSSTNGNQNDESQSSNNRRSQRRRTNVQSNMRSSSLITTILTETTHHNECSTELSKENDERNDERRSLLPTSTDQLVFSTSKSNPKTSFWTVTDRQAEWYKLTIPIQQATNPPPSSSSSSSSNKSLSVTCRTLPKVWQRKKSNSNVNENNEQITDTTQLILKAVMHELDYDLDQDDLQYLDEFNTVQKSRGERSFTEEEFENALIILEYYAAEQIRLHLKQKSCDDENIVCDICLLPDADDGNEMVFCERCNACVHQNCYGIANIPTGTWLCKPCSIVRRPACLLCPKFGGPMKCTPSGTVWCHLTCALWLPELKFGDYLKMEPILNLDKIPHARWTLRCIVCSSSEGACVQCAHKNCRTPFHVTCGLSAGYFLDVQQTSATDGASTSRSQFNAYCLKHSDEARQRSEPDSSDHPIPLTVYRRQICKQEQWLVECYANLTKFVSSSHLHDQSPLDYDAEASQRIYNYWKEKREKRNYFPLIPRIDFVLEQRENAELILAQINYSLKIRCKVRQLQDYSQSTLFVSSFASTLTERLERLKNHFHSFSKHSAVSRATSSLPSNNVYSLKSSKDYYQLIENSKRCIVGLETTFRDGLELNTTYLIGQTLEGETMLFPKEMMEQGNVIPISETDLIEEVEETPLPPAPASSEPTFEMSKTPYACRGNLVTCVTGSFD